MLSSCCVVEVLVADPDPDTDSTVQRRSCLQLWGSWRQPIRENGPATARKPASASALASTLKAGVVSTQGHLSPEEPTHQPEYRKGWPWPGSRFIALGVPYAPVGWRRGQCLRRPLNNREVGISLKASWQKASNTPSISPKAGIGFDPRGRDALWEAGIISPKK